MEDNTFKSNTLLEGMCVDDLLFESPAKAYAQRSKFRSRQNACGFLSGHAGSKATKILEGFAEAKSQLA